MASPAEWRIDDIERLARNAAPRHEIESIRGDVARVERAIGEVSAALDGLRAELQTMQARIATLETPENA